MKQMVKFHVDQTFEIETDATSLSDLLICFREYMKENYNKVTVRSICK
jgi:hypothetical protein